MIQFILISVLISQITGWQVTVDFDLKLKNLSNLFDKSEFKVFESVYFNNDYFALLSVDRNNFIDATQGFMMIGARLAVIFISLFFQNLELISFSFLKKLFVSIKPSEFDSN
jgi:hypothetical protein